MSRRVSKILSLLFVALFVAALGGPAGAAKKTPPGDPPGNNGTVKIEQGAQGDEDLGNEPHGDNCNLWLEFYGFDANQTATITFALQSPTKPKGTDPVLLQDKDVQISKDAAGGGPNDRETDVAAAQVDYGYMLSQALDGVTPHPKQGYHIKLSVDVNGAPGASKHKVFWLAPCAQTGPASTLRIAKALEGTGQGPFAFDLNCNHRPLNRTFTLQGGDKLDITDVPPGTTCVVSETDKKNAESTTIAEDPPHGKADDGEVTVGKGTATIVKFTNKFPGTGSTPAPPNNDLRPPAGTPAGSANNGGAGNTGTAGTNVGGTGTSANPGTSVLGETQTAPQAAATLPRTGQDPRPLTATGLSALGAGVALLVATGRRRRS
jgi:hypothetical protein